MNPLTLTPEQQEALVVLDRFDVRRWVRWIAALVEDGECQPDLHIGEMPPNQVLTWLYREGLSRTGYFSEALGEVYAGSTPARAKSVLYLLQAIAVVRPPNCKNLLLRHLKRKRLDGATYGSFDLKTLALAARSNYDIDSKLLEFVERSALASPGDFAYQLTCFRTRAKHDFRVALVSLDLLLPHLVQEGQQKVFGGVLRGIVRIESCRELYWWYLACGNSLEPGEFHNLRESLKHWVIPWAPQDVSDPSALDELDPYAVLLSAHLLAGDWPFVAEELLFIAQMAEHRLIRDRGEEERVQKALREVWDRSVPRVAEWAEQPNIVRHLGPQATSLPWEGPPASRLLRTNWRATMLDLHRKRKLFGQIVRIPESDHILRSLSRGRRATYRLPQPLSERPEPEDEFDRIIEGRRATVVSHSSLEEFQVAELGADPG